MLNNNNKNNLIQRLKKKKKVDLPNAIQSISSNKNNGKLQEAKKDANRQTPLKKAEEMLRKAVAEIKNKNNRVSKCKTYGVKRPCGYFTSTLESVFEYCHPVRICIESFNSL